MRKPRVFGRPRPELALDEYLSEVRESARDTVAAFFREEGVVTAADLADITEEDLSRALQTTTQTLTLSHRSAIRSVVARVQASDGQSGVSSEVDSRHEEGDEQDALTGGLTSAQADGTNTPMGDVMDDSIDADPKGAIHPCWCFVLIMAFFVFLVFYLRQEPAHSQHAAVGKRTTRRGHRGHANKAAASTTSWIDGFAAPAATKTEETEKEEEEEVAEESATIAPTTSPTAAPLDQPSTSVAGIAPPTTATTALPTSTTRVAAEPCDCVEGVDLHSDNYLVDQMDASSPEDCCQRCQADTRCVIAMFRHKEKRCFLKHVVGASFRSPGVTACAVPGRAPNSSQWGPRLWETERQACAASRPPVLPPVPSATAFPPIIWRAYQEFAESKKPGSSTGSGSHPLASIEVALPLDPPVLRPMGDDVRTGVFLVGFPGQLRPSGPEGRCVVYVVGFQGAAFADRTATLGCDTYLFDCMVKPLSVPSKRLISKPWCIVDADDAITKSNIRPVEGGEFKDFREAMSDLGHLRINLLRLETDDRRGRDDSWLLRLLGGALLFVPEVEQVSVRMMDQSRPFEASTVFEKMHAAGYWVVSKTILTVMTGTCSEVLLLYVGPGGSAGLAPVAWRAFEAASSETRERLLKGTGSDAMPTSEENVFEAVGIAIPLPWHHPQVIDHDWRHGDGQGNKNLVGKSQLRWAGRNCVVYGIGISGDSGFEEGMAKFGCETHAFDCTIPKDFFSVKGKAFQFHHWCIGNHSVTMENKGFMNQYFEREGNHMDEGEMAFRTLPETMALLKHDAIDVLKFDIEGFEWQLFEQSILPGIENFEQISFELHTRFASPTYVPIANSKCKDYAAVNRLFLALYDRGYRVVSKEVNQDPACAEFVVVNVNLRSQTSEPHAEPQPRRLPADEREAVVPMVTI